MNTLVKRLAELSSAEDFLEFFGIPYEESVLNVKRLHILKRFFQYLRQEPIMETASEAETFRQMRRLLAKSYEDFVHSTPAREKVFRVLQTSEGQCVPISSLTDSLRRHRGR